MYLSIRKLTLLLTVHPKDLDGTGHIRYTEFLASTIEARGAIDERRLAEAFDRLDSDDSGYITVENLREILGDEFPQEEIDAIIRESDITKDGRISYFEFLAQWQDQNETKRHDDFVALQDLTSDDSNIDNSHISASQQNVPFDDESCGSGDDEPEDMVARANFLEGKQLSERKASVAAKVEDPFVVEDPSANKKVVQSADV